MSQNRKNTAPRPEFNTNGKAFTAMSWGMGVLCFLLAVLYFIIYFNQLPPGSLQHTPTLADFLMGVLYLLGGTLILPPLRRVWQRVLGIQLYGNRLIYIYLGFFLMLMGMSWVSNLLQEQQVTATYQEEKTRHVARVPVDSLLAPVQKGLFWGYVNTQGALVIPADQYEAAGAFRSGYAEVKRNGQTLTIDRKGQEVTAPAQLPAADSIASPLQPASQQGLWGWKNAAGDWVIAPAFDAVGPWGRAYNPAK
jgi:hypothetical protein